MVSAFDQKRLTRKKPISNFGKIKLIEIKYNVLFRGKTPQQLNLVIADCHLIDVGVYGFISSFSRTPSLEDGGGGGGDDE